MWGFTQSQEALHTYTCGKKGREGEGGNSHKHEVFTHVHAWKEGQKLGREGHIRKGRKVEWIAGSETGRHTEKTGRNKSAQKCVCVHNTHIERGRRVVAKAIRDHSVVHWKLPVLSEWTEAGWKGT